MCIIIMLFIVSFFFFFKQKTAYEMRISDWSSDVCSSDLNQKFGHPERLIAKHRDGELAPLDEGFGEQTVELLPGAHRLSRDRIAVIAVVLDDRNADRRAFVDRLEDIRARQGICRKDTFAVRSEEHTSELQSLMRISYAVF